jgi:uncharacterized protein (UPF0335 family)
MNSEHLKSLIERVERLTQDKTDIQDDIKEVFLEAKSAGFDVAIMRQVIKLRKIEESKRAELDYLTTLYLEALS